MRIAEALRDAALSLSSANPRLEAELLLAHVLWVSRTFLYSEAEKNLAPQQMQDFTALIQQRVAGKTIA